MENKTHYFVSFIYGWAVAPTREEAIQKLLKTWNTEFREITKTSQKNGRPGAHLWSCEVIAPYGSEYQINFYKPEGVPTKEPLHHHVTYITSKQNAYTSEKQLAEVI